MVLLVGCAASVEPATSEVVSIDEVEVSCAALSCDLLVCGSCPACGRPETTCKCYALHYDGSDEQGVPCVTSSD